jgi:hypothetical protein
MVIPIRINIKTEPAIRIYRCDQAWSKASAVSVLIFGLNPTNHAVLFKPLREWV